MYFLFNCKIYFPQESKFAELDQIPIPFTNNFSPDYHSNMPSFGYILSKKNAT